jgi:hypothetical protein
MAHFEVVRSTTIAADTARVHGLVDDFRAWRAWSPWEELDPELSRDYSGPATGVGSRYAWQGNRKAGQGSMEIISSTPEQIVIKLEFLKPWKATNETTFSFSDVGDAGTEVTWRMTGENKGMAALFMKLFRMDKYIGKDFDKGLAQLKATAEGPA